MAVDCEHQAPGKGQPRRSWHRGKVGRRWGAFKANNMNVLGIGTVCQVGKSSVGLGTTNPFRRSRRGRIRSFSRKSRRRLARVCQSVEGRPGVRQLFLTLTFPGLEGQEFIPTDGITANRVLARFRVRLAELLNVPHVVLTGVWKREFQTRKGDGWWSEIQRRAVHFHVWLDVATFGFRQRGELVVFRDFVDRAWAEAVGARARTQVRFWVGSVSKYVKAYAEKRDSPQNVPPAGFEPVGRFWGRWGQLGFDGDLLDVGGDYRAWAAVRRVLRRYQLGRAKAAARAAGRRFRKPRPRGCRGCPDYKPMWVCFSDVATRRRFFVQLARWLQVEIHDVSSAKASVLVGPGGMRDVLWLQSDGTYAGTPPGVPPPRAPAGGGPGGV